MINFTLEELNNDAMNGALDKLSNLRFKDMSVTYNVSKITSALKKEINLAKQLLSKIMKENGEASQEEQKKLMDTFFSTQVSINRPKINFKDIMEAKPGHNQEELVAIELVALEPFIYSLEAVEPTIVEPAVVAEVMASAPAEEPAPAPLS